MGRTHLVIAFVAVAAIRTAAAEPLTLAPKRADGVDGAVNAGLIQPILFHGVNLAGELRLDRWVFEYSHGQWLQLDRVSFSRTDGERAAGLSLEEVWTTGAGVGVVLLDELYAGAEVKVHRFDAALPGGDRGSYRTMSVGPWLGWRYFVFGELHVNVYLRWWPNVWTSTDGLSLRAADGSILMHAPFDHGVFANASIGWAFR